MVSDFNDALLRFFVNGIRDAQRSLPPNKRTVNMNTPREHNVERSRLVVELNS